MGWKLVRDESGKPLRLERTSGNTGYKNIPSSLILAIKDSLECLDRAWPDSEFHMKQIAEMSSVSESVVQTVCGECQEFFQSNKPYHYQLKRY